MTNTTTTVPTDLYSLMIKHLGAKTTSLLCITRWKDGIDIDEPCGQMIRLAAALASPPPSTVEPVVPIKTVIREIRTTEFDTPAQPAVPVPQWQDIATAPKDGRTLLLWAHNDVYTACWDDNYVWAKGWISVYARSDTISIDPTHWMPLPAAPLASPTPPKEPTA